VERAPLEEPFDEMFAFGFRSVYEAGTRLLGALGTEQEFPRDVEGVEALIERAVVDPETEVMRFRVEAPGALPRFTAEHFTWVCPTGDGSLRLRDESWAMEAYAATLTPDGRFGDFVHERGFGVPDSELTEQARADRDLVERRRREAEVEDRESSRRIAEGQRRFRTEYLRGVRAAPWQDPDGPVIAWVAYYDVGFIVALIRPSAREEDGPPLEVRDDLGNSYPVVGHGRTQVHRPLHHDLLEFGPAVADGATRLIFCGASGSVEVEVAR
jgi:hypothetical protein